MNRFVATDSYEKVEEGVEKDLSVITCYIDKICSPVLDDIFKRGRHFDIYIPCLSVRGLHVLSILTKYLTNIHC